VSLSSAAQVQNGVGTYRCSSVRPHTTRGAASFRPLETPNPPRPLHQRRPRAGVVVRRVKLTTTAVVAMARSGVWWARAAGPLAACTSQQACVLSACGGTRGMLSPTTRHSAVVPPGVISSWWASHAGRASFLRERLWPFCNPEGRVQGGVYHSGRQQRLIWDMNTARYRIVLAPRTTESGLMWCDIRLGR